MEQTTALTTPLQARRLSEELACEGYLTARKALAGLAGRAASLSRLVAEHPDRVDYRAARNDVLTKYGIAARRTRAAWLAWQRAQHRSDAAWTATEGRLSMSDRRAA